MKDFARNIGLLFIAPFAILSAAAAPSAPSFKKVMIVVFENEDAQNVLNQPTFRSIASQGAYLANFRAETHPSQANYIALVSGDMNGVRGDGAVNLDVHHIGDLLEAAGRDWKIYLEGYPGNCFTGARSGNYVRKHNPFISFVNVQSDAARCNRHLVGAGKIDADIANGTLPDFSVYVPDMKNDGHDTGVVFADRWLAQVFVPYLKDPKFMRDMLVIFTFDESQLKSSSGIYTSLFGSSVKAGSSSPVAYNHYSILRTIEDTLGIGSLGKSDSRATPITGVWQ